MHITVGACFFFLYSCWLQILSIESWRWSGPQLHMRTSENIAWLFFSLTSSSIFHRQIIYWLLSLIIMNIDILLFYAYVASIAHLSIPGRGIPHLWLSSLLQLSSFSLFFLSISIFSISAYSIPRQTMFMILLHSFISHLVSCFICLSPGHEGKSRSDCSQLLPPDPRLHSSTGIA